ncbi:MAG: FUSC family protein [Flavobacteriales bacterium]|nr:FUSC family protein [Flavobacteriales bacterium]
MLNVKDISTNLKNKFKRGRYLYGLQGMINMLVPYFITLQFANETEALISALVGLFMFIEHKNFGFKRRIAQSLTIVGIQIIFLVTISVYFSSHFYLAIPFNFLLFFSLNYYNYIDSPNSISFVPIQYFYLISLTTPINIEELPLRIFAILTGLVFSAIGLLLFWPTKTHKTIEYKLQDYLKQTKQILEFDINKYGIISEKFKIKQNSRFAEIMNVLYGLKYGDIFSTTKGKYLFKIAINIQILNNSLHSLKKFRDLKIYKENDAFYRISEKWKNQLIRVISLLEKTVIEDKHSLLLIEKEYNLLNSLSKEVNVFLEQKQSENLRVKFNEIDYLVSTLIDFSKSLILFKHRVQKVETKKLDFLYRFDNFRHNILRSISIKQASVRFALHISILLTLSLLLVAYFDIFEGFWIPMTILMIMKPNHGGTKKQTIARLSGTLVGLIISFAIIELFPVYVVPSAIIFAIYMAVVMIKDEYGLAVVFITMGVVLLMSYDFKANDIFLTRLFLTIVTAIIVLISNSLILPNWSKNDIRHRMIDTLKSDLLVIKTTLEKADGISIYKDKIRLNMLNSYQGRMQIKELYTKMKSEPKSKQLNKTIGKQFLVAHERFSQNYNRFVYAILTKKTKVEQIPYSLISKNFASVIKNIIHNLDNNNIKGNLNDIDLTKLLTLMIDIEINDNLNDEQLILVQDLNKTTKRLLELNHLSMNKDLVFVSI